MSALEIFIWPTPNAHKITILIEELGLDYNITWIDIIKGDQFEPDFLKIAPNNRMPAIIDPNGPEGDAISVFESGAILLYLARKYGKFYPSDLRGQTKVDEWLMWQMGGLGPMAGQAHHFRHYAPEQVPYGIKRYTDEAARLYGVLDRNLADKDYVAGDYSIADMAIFGWVNSHERHGQDLNDFKNVQAWFERMSSKPAVQKALTLKP